MNVLICIHCKGLVRFAGTPGRWRHQARHGKCRTRLTRADIMAVRS